MCIRDRSSTLPSSGLSASIILADFISIDILESNSCKYNYKFFIKVKNFQKHPNQREQNHILQDHFCP